MVSFLENGAVRLRARVDGAGPALLLIHGWALDLDMWLPQFRDLQSSCRVIAFDRRGFGLSSGEPGIANDIEDVGFLLDALSLPNIAIVGMSQGARVALRFALRFPERVSCLILDGPPREEGAQAAASSDELPMPSYRELLVQHGIEAFRQEWLRHPFMRLRTRDVAARALLQRIVERYPGNDLRTHEPLRALSAADLSSMTLPVLVINGRHDTPERRSSGADLARALPNARRTFVAAAGHLPNLDNPDAYNALLREFVRAHGQRVPSARGDFIA